MLRTGRPSEETLQIFLKACRVPRVEWQRWLDARERALLQQQPATTSGASTAGRWSTMPLAGDADPLKLGVHPAINVPSADGVLPSYVERDVDQEVRALVERGIEQGGMILLVAGPGAGKSRVAFEAVRQSASRARLFHPYDMDELRQMAMDPPGPMLVWLDEMQRYLEGPDGLEAAVVRRLIDAGSLIMATLRPCHYATYLAATDPDQDQRRMVLTLADVVHVNATLSSAELARARAVARYDTRITYALRTSHIAGLTQILAGGPRLIERLRSAGPYAMAVVKAAIDARRTGVDLPLPADLLRRQAPRYCDPCQRAAAPADWFEAALAYATTPVHGGIPLLMPYSSGSEMGQADGYLVADYLLHLDLQELPVPDMPLAAAPAQNDPDPISNTVNTEMDTIGRADIAVLVADTQYGDARVWKELVECFTPVLKARISDWGISDEDAQYVLQATWLYVVRDISRLNSPRIMNAWLAAIVTRECVRLVRRTKKTSATRFDIDLQVTEKKIGAWLDRRLTELSDEPSKEPSFDNIDLGGRLDCGLVGAQDVNMDEA
ncbi:RNA polymerase sigma factor [Nonomuraea phyllanthi]|uniref:RNA polymerase sigma factor n=1 Tax=Nonomuraea phyllanthi TaxID=2219224 RepID=UPI001D145561|nr:hypothetical protein [Nonomuraea phyllanthi]